MTIKLPKVEVQRGYMVTCHAANCGPIGFAPKQSGAQKLEADHLAEHKRHNDRVTKQLEQLEKDQKDAAEKSGVNIDPILHCPGDKCNAPVGLPHTSECDVARCLVTGTQRRLIEHIKNLAPEDREAHKCGNDVWTGYWPGDYEAALYGVQRNDVQRMGRWDVDRLQWVIDSLEQKEVDA